MKTAVILLSLSLISFSAGCGRDGKESAEVKAGTAKTAGTGYLDTEGWKKAKAEIKTVEDVLKNLFDDWDGAFSLAITHRQFGQFDQAIAAAKTLPGKTDGFVSSIDRLKSIPNYPEFDEIRKCFIRMEPHMRTSSSLLEQSLIAGKAFRQKEEAALKMKYTLQYRKVMALGRRIFEIFTEMYTRGARTEYQDMTGVKVTGPDQVRNFRSAAAKVAASFNILLAKEIPATERSAARHDWERTIVQTAGINTTLQSLIIETGKLEPGNSKELWDARTTLTTALSYRLFAVQKLSEYAQKRKAGDDNGAASMTKLLDVMRKCADDEYKKFRKLRY